MKTGMLRRYRAKRQLRGDLVQLDLEMFTEMLERYREDQNRPKEVKQENAVLPFEKQAKEFLTKANLIKRWNDLIGKAGVVGEENSRIFLMAIAVTHKMNEPLHALIQGSSGSGKTHLMAKICGFIPQRDRKNFTRVTEGSLYNYGMYDLQNKLICIEDLDGMKEEAQFAFRELQSKGMIISSTSIKDENGSISASEKTVYGPIASMSCTTKGEIYEDNMSRCFIIAVDESSEQSRKAGIMFESILLKVDELDGSLRQFYERLKTYVKSRAAEHHLTYEFGQREVRQALNVSKTQLHRYLNDLEQLEYIRKSGGYANRGFNYKVVYWDNIGALRSKVKRYLQGQLDQLELVAV